MNQSVSVETVINMIQQRHRGLPIEKDTIAQWCGECVEQIGCFESLELNQQVPVEITNGLGALPCTVYRFLKLHNCECLPQYKIEVPYIRIKGYNGVVHVDYLSVPIDDKGYPKIDTVARMACYYYCLSQLKYDDFLNGKVNPAAWNDIVTNRDYHMDAARGSMRNVSIDDTNRISAIMFNTTKSVMSPPTYGTNN